MVEDMYQQESKEEGENQNHSPRHKDDQDQDHDDNIDDYDNDNDNDEQQIQSIENTRYHHNQTPIAPPAPPHTTAPTYTTTTTSTHAKRSEINESENDPSLLAINTQNCFSENQAMMSYSYSGGITTVATQPPSDADTCRRGSMFGADQYRTTTTGDDDHATNDIGSTLIRFGTTSGDVSLTLGLRHAGGNLPAEKTSFFS